MVVTRSYNGTVTTVYNNTVNDSSGGGVMDYNATLPGTYLIRTTFKHTDYSEFTPTPTSFIIGTSQGAGQVIELLNTGFINGWAYYFLAVVIAMIAAGFALRFSPEASGAVGLLVLWIFTFMYPSGVIVTVGGVGLTTLYATILTTVMVLAVMFLKWFV
jgi:hypothetical protein